MPVTPSPRRIALTGSETALGRALRQALTTTSSLTPLSDADIGDRQRLAAVGGESDTIIHLVHEPPGASEADELAALDRATRGTYDLLTALTPHCLILVTSLRPLSHYPADYRVDEQFAPRPAPVAAELIPYLAEITAREVSRVRPTRVIVLRVGTIVDPAPAGAAPVATDALHLADAVRGVERALAYDGATQPGRYHVFHLVDGGTHRQFDLAAAGQPAFGYAPEHRLTDGAVVPAAAAPVPAPIPSRPIRTVTSYGAGGPLGAIVASNLAPDYTLRLTDLRSQPALAAMPPQSPGAPQLAAWPPPHTHAVVDVADPAQVRAAAAGADALLNCTVLRTDPVGAFQVNTLGALNVMRAAVANDIRRVVQTGPLLTLLPHPAGYNDEFDLVDDLPPRPGDNLYFVSKYLGQEICRIFAEAYQLEVPTLLFGNFANPAQPPLDPALWYPFAVSWADAAQAVRRALALPALPRPFEVLHILTDLPHGKYTNAKARMLLGWQPVDQLDASWRRGPANR